MDLEQRILLRMATAKDAAMADLALARQGIVTRACADIAELVDEYRRGAGALMVAEEEVVNAKLDALADALARQPPWSDIAVLVLARTGADSRAVAMAMERFANVAVIERPVRVASLVSAARSALRARHRQYELRALLDGLREADQRKTEFLATLAHELRNPLAPISATLHLLLQSRQPPADPQRHYAMMRRQVDHMTRLVDDLLEVARITRGKIDLRLAPVALAAVIDDAIELSRPLLDGATHRLVVELPPEPLVVSGDRVRLAQVYANLLNNAARYTPPGGRITIAARREGADAVVEVGDSGAGIEPHMLESVFEMFVQAGTATARRSGGLGIGLTLVRNLVELHGGSVAAHSGGPGRGSTFTVRLPLAEPVAAPAAAAVGTAAPVPVGAPKTVLVVDDNRDAADALSELLQVMGVDAVATYSASEALQLASARTIDAAVLDIGMPDVDGCELARRLRAESGNDGMTLIALTGWGQEADRDRIAAAGFDHHLLKPADADQLLRLLEAAGTSPGRRTRFSPR